jgi:hypothetical protein
MGGKGCTKIEGGKLEPGGYAFARSGREMPFFMTALRGN